MNPSWGTKRTCTSCSTHFYDLNKLPATCPKCGHTFDPTVVVRAKRKTVRREPLEAKTEISASMPALKKAVKKDPKEEVDGGDDSDIVQIEDGDDLENLQELSELEEIEEKPANSDDADDESIIEELGEGDGKGLVGNVEEEEANALSEELSDEEKEGSTAKNTSKKAKPKKKSK